MKLIRYIHPIGQGAFYTEQFFDDNNNRIATVVYDCGSSTNKADIEREIRGAFEKDEEIEYLFISHFHNDHINGIDELKKRTHIKNVVIPLYNDYDRLLYLATITTHDERVYKKLAKLIINPKVFFNEETDTKQKHGRRDYDTKIIRIRPMNESSESFSNDVLDIKESGTVIKMSLQGTITHTPHAEWEYVPLNNNQRETSDAFKNECQQNLIIGDINQFIQDKTNRDRLKEIYKKVFGNKSLNESSMMVYSGLKDNDTDLKGNSIPNACLYTGDATFNVQVLKQMQPFWKTRIKNITLFQIPHHASQQSFDIEIIDRLKLAPSCLIVFASCGNMNTYGHPSPYVITQCNLFLKDHNKFQTEYAQHIDFITEQRVRIVTESKNTMLVLVYDFNNN